jgi:AP-1 complex subunit gamma-1
MENYVEKANKLLNEEKNHAILLTGITLLTEMCLLDKNVLNDTRKNVPRLVRILRNLITNNFSPEHDVNGVADPFLQVQILRLLRLLGHNNVEASDLMNDVLAQVATNTDNSKNVGNSILYETVLTIMNIESEKSLQVMAINILGRFLSNRDNNIKYVALTTLCQVASILTDSSSLQRHSTTIIDCIKDTDISIRKRAIDLAFILMNRQNIKVLARELLVSLETTTNEEKAKISRRLCECANRYKSNKRWEIDTVCRVLKIAGGYVEQDVINNFIRLVTNSSTELQQYTTNKLYNILNKKDDAVEAQEGLQLASIWCIGEYCDLLLQSPLDDSLANIDEDENNATITSDIPSEHDVIYLLERLLEGSHVTNKIRQYILIALVKLTNKLESDCRIRINGLISKYKTNINLELQQRAIEFNALDNLNDEIRSVVLDRMPALENTKENRKQNLASESTLLSDEQLDTNNTSNSNDLLGMIFGESTNPSTNANPKPITKSSSSSSNDIMDLLGDLQLGTSTTPALTPSNNNNSVNLPNNNAPVTNSGSNLDSLLSLGNIMQPTNSSNMTSLLNITQPSTNNISNPITPMVSSSNIMTPISATPITSIPATPFTPLSAASAIQKEENVLYYKNGLKITFEPSNENPIIVVLKTKYQADPSYVIDKINLLVAVPKSMKLQINPPSASVCTPDSPINQIIKIANPSKSPIKIRIKLSYSSNGNQVNEMFDYSSFSESLWA